MAGEDEAGVGEGEDLSVQAVVESRGDGLVLAGKEVGSAHVADEERVTRVRWDRPVAASRVRDHVGDAVGRMAGRVEHVDPQLLELHRVVADGYVLELAAARGRGADRRARGPGDSSRRPETKSALEVRLEDVGDCEVELARDRRKRSMSRAGSTMAYVLPAPRR